MSGNSWVASSGSSKLFGSTFSNQPLTTTERSVQAGDATVQEIDTQSTSGSVLAPARYVVGGRRAGNRCDFNHERARS